MIAKIMQVLKKSVLKYWGWRLQLFVMGVLLTLLLSAVHYIENSKEAYTQMTLNYSEASRGLNPNRTRFSTNDLSSDVVLQNTIKNAGLTELMTIEELKESISVDPIDVTNVSSSDDYITTTYQISLKLKKRYPHLTARTILEIYCGSYKDYFMEHYGENQSVFASTMPSYFETEPYLQLKSLTLRANQLNRYLDGRVDENKSYVDESSGNSFLGLSKQIQNIITYEIPRIQAYILRGGLAVDAGSLNAMLNHKLQLEQKNYDEQMAYYNADNLGISLYDETMSAIVMIPTLDENQEFYMSRTKTALDTMASDADGTLQEAASHQDVITSTQYVINQMALLSDPEGLEQVKAMLSELNQSLNNIQQALRVTDASYIIYKTQNYLVFDYNAISFSQQIALRKIMMELMVFVMVSFIVCIIRTVKTTREGLLA